MAIDFDASRWATIRSTYRQWWDGELERPLIPAQIKNRNPGRPMPGVPLLDQATCADFSIPPEQIIDRLDYDLSCNHFLGDAFPAINMHSFGPGVLAAFLGATLDNSTGRVWFHPPKHQPIDEIHFHFDPDNRWFRRLCDIYRAGMERWEGNVLMTMTDLGGNLDILSTFRPSGELLMDLYDAPEEVKRLTEEAHSAWHQAFEALNAVLQPCNPGYSDWSGIYSDTPSYILQCDFCYMIGPEMFDEFVKPELTATCRKLARSFYHLDGKGQLAHLDSLLSIPELGGVQWVPGDGAPNCRHWPEVFQKIAASGKRIQLLGELDTLDTVIEQIGTGKGIHLTGALRWQEEGDPAALRTQLARYGVE